MKLQPAFNKLVAIRVDEVHVMDPGTAFTVNAFGSVVLCPSGLVTVTLRVPIVAVFAMVIFAVNCEDELNVQELTVMPLPKLHVAPLRKFVPVKVTVRL